MYLKYLLFCGVGVLHSGFLEEQLFHAIENGATVDALALLAEGADVNVRDDNGNTPLLRACHFANYTIVKACIARKGKINVCNNYGSNPLSCAVMNNNVRLARLLLKKGACVNYTAKGSWPPLLAAVSINAYPAIIQLLIRHGADVHFETPQHSTPLLFARRNGNAYHISLLLEAGACNQNVFSPTLPLRTLVILSVLMLFFYDLLW